MHRRTGERDVASGRSPNPGPHLVGREVELLRLASLLATARDGHGGVLLLEGEAGIGKTTLLDVAAARAEGFLVLRATGVEADAVLPYGGLLELLGPLRDRAPALPVGQAAALARVLGWDHAADGPVDRFLVAAATLSLLAEAAAAGPVLVLVDDLMWLDRESVSALLFAVRRLGQDRVAVLLATRGGVVPAGLLDGLPVLAVPGLDEGDTRRMLGGVTDDVARRLHGATGGNPLALLEVAGQITGAQRAGGAELPDPLPVGGRVGLALDATLAALPPAAARAVLLAALHPQPADPVVAAALSASGVEPAAALDAAVDHGVLRPLPGGGHDFRHPLLRAAAVRRATAAERRDAHRLLAAASPAAAADPLALWHLASAADAPDEELAGRLEELASRSRSRTGSTAASVALERAAWLTPDPGRAASRRAAAAYDAFVGGDVDRTRRLARLVLDRDDCPEQARATAGFALGMLEQYAGSVPAAASLLAQAAASADDALRVAVLGELAMTGFRLGDLATVDACAAQIADAADEARPDHLLWREFTSGIALVVRGDHEAGRERLRGVVALVPGLPDREAPLALLLLALSTAFLGDVRPAMESGERLLAEVRRQGAMGMLVPTLAIVAAGRAWLGDHAGAFADAGEAVELGTHLGYVADVAVAEETLAWQLAARGRHPEATAALARARGLTDRAGTTAVAAHLALTAAFCALSRDDPAGVVAELEPRLELDGGVGAMGEPLGVAPLLVEAYVALGRRDDARALARRLEAVTPASAPAPHRALCLRTRGLAAARDDESVTAYEAALAAHAEAPEVFERARTTLLLGQRLRRAGQRVSARERLREAQQAFVGMDLTGWAERAGNDLAASGARRRRAAEPADASLTSQETRVARLVAEGLTNREVAAALFLSPRTVEHHLGSVFRKRGWRSRSELVRAMAGGPPG